MHRRRRSSRHQGRVRGAAALRLRRRTSEDRCCRHRAAQLRRLPGHGRKPGARRRSDRAHPEERHQLQARGERLRVDEGDGRRAPRHRRLAPGEVRPRTGDREVALQEDRSADDGRARQGLRLGGRGRRGRLRGALHCALLLGVARFRQRVERRQRTGGSHLHPERLRHRRPDGRAARRSRGQHQRFAAKHRRRIRQQVFCRSLGHQHARISRRPLAASRSKTCSTAAPNSKSPA